MSASRDFHVVLKTPWGGPWRAFREPTAVLTARTAAAVRPCLAEIDRAVRDRGCYAAGFVTYEAASAFGLPTQTPAADGPPLVAFGLFERESVTSHARPRPTETCATGEWTPSIAPEACLRTIGEIKQRLEAGEPNQVYFTFRLSAEFSGDPLALLADLDAEQTGAWGAFVDTGRHVICSASPELFFALNNGRIRCRPMKGTAPRGLWPAADLREAAALHRSWKHRAENVMVVEMVRNDLGRIARAGSAEVSSLFDVERYPRQWQMTSTVTAETLTTSLVEIFEALFPSGSVTGAPKPTAMGIIRDLETGPRGIYTGAIGYVSPNGRSHFSVAIRTIAIDRARGQAEFGVGSGIVRASIERDEYAECLLKASIVARPRAFPPFELLETIGYTPEEGFRVLAQHMERLRASAEYFGFPCDLAAFRAVLDQAVTDLRGPSKLRVLLSRDGSFSCEAVDVHPPGARRRSQRPYTAALAAEPVDPGDVFLYHQTTRREVYERARVSQPEADVVVLWNRAGEITESTESNVVAEIDGHLVTPPVECGLLAGTYRAALLASNELGERRITVDELRAVRRFWLINSVRGWIDAELIESVSG